MAAAMALPPDDMKQDLTGYTFVSACRQEGTFISGTSHILRRGLCKRDLYLSSCKFHFYLFLSNAVVQLEDGNLVHIENNEDARIQPIYDTNGNPVPSSQDVLLYYRCNEQGNKESVYAHIKCGMDGCTIDRFE
jgi:hypothetical protein